MLKRFFERRKIINQAVTQAKKELKKADMFRELSTGGFNYAILQDLVNHANEVGRVIIKITGPSGTQTELIIEPKTTRDQLDYLTKETDFYSTGAILGPGKL